MDDVKDKMKGFMKNLTTSNSKFKGQGRILGSSSSSSSDTNATNSRLVPPLKSNPCPKPSPKLCPPCPKPSTEFNPYDPLITTGNRSAAPAPAALFNCPICSSSFASESAVSDHIDLCLATNPDADTTSTSTNVAESVSLYLSNQPPKDSVEVVIKLLSNVVRDPGNEKFRRIRMGNPKIKEVVGDVKGGVEVLECVGFRVGEEEEGEEVWGTMEAPSEDEVRVIKEAVLLLERWKEGLPKENGVVAHAVKENRVVEQKKIDRQVNIIC